LVEAVLLVICVELELRMKRRMVVVLMAVRSRQI
jgi:hypothetical protein